MPHYQTVKLTPERGSRIVSATVKQEMERLQRKTSQSTHAISLVHSPDHRDHTDPMLSACLPMELLLNAVCSLQGSASR